MFLNNTYVLKTKRIKKYIISCVKFYHVMFKITPISRNCYFKFFHIYKTSKKNGLNHITL